MTSRCLLITRPISQGMLVKESEVVMLAQRLLNAEVPYEGGSGT